MIIQNIDFRAGEVIVSVGFFRARDLRPLFRGKCGPLYVEAYEPKKDICQAYKRAIAPHARFAIVPKAVSDSVGVSSLTLCSTKSTICSIEEPQVDSYQVEVVSIAAVLESVLLRYDRIDKLLLNCEGSEIPIIKDTPLIWFNQCKYIFVQFHPFIPALNITMDDVAFCVKKLESRFTMRVLNKKYCKYEFVKK